MNRGGRAVRRLPARQPSNGARYTPGAGASVSSAAGAGIHRCSSLPALVLFPVPEDLNFIETDALINELMERSSAFVLGMIPKANPDKAASLHYAGSRMANIGMLDQLHFNLLTMPARKLNEGEGHEG
jgi:hypothetical protein